MKTPESRQSAADSFWNLTPDKAVLEVSSDLQGLSERSAQDRLKQNGPNSLKGSSKTSAVMLFLLQFKSPITLLLIAAAMLSLALKDNTDAIIILIIVLVSGLLGWWQEKGAANALDQLMKMVQINCRVLRDGKEKEIHVEEVVTGEIGRAHV